MDSWKYFDITHSGHLLCNPLNEEKLDRLVDLIRLEPASRVLEIAAGKGEFLARLAEKYNVSGVAVDLSPFCVAEAREKLRARAPESEITVLEMDGAEYQPEAPASFDLAACLGGSWIFGGHEGTLAALKEMVVPGGVIAVGEPFWLQEPAPEYLQAVGWERETFGSHYANVQTGEALGLELEYAMVSSHDDWDWYEGLQWHAAARYARNHPDDPDLQTLRERVAESREVYLKWGRETLGWAVYLFRKRE